MLAVLRPEGHGSTIVEQEIIRETIMFREVRCRRRGKLPGRYAMTVAQGFGGSAGAGSGRG